MHHVRAPLAAAAIAALIVIAGCGNQSGPGTAPPSSSAPAGAATATPRPEDAAPKTAQPPPPVVAAPAMPDAPTAAATAAATAATSAAGTAAKSADAARAARAAQLFAVNCVTCHGPTGKGDGMLVSGLPVKPRSFAADAWRFVDFDEGDDVVHAAIEKVLREGIRDAMMPGYASALSDAQITALVDYVLELRRNGRAG